ncbi:polypeptide N-acetylgalactosaminyltransferase 6 [Aplysia californica]|uniref:Polypeptide N-acetylgalactosaminyltransferase n=1 Tax=Aplysia californica TaxID=6500 RepID=A0ABM0K7E5_APLCA|nr:polypeptide N-acetylgalactosaminyltransferase 6 [Aplysia californica]
MSVMYTRFILVRLARWLRLQKPLARLLLLAVFLVVCLHFSARLMTSLSGRGISHVKTRISAAGKRDLDLISFRKLSQDSGLVGDGDGNVGSDGEGEGEGEGEGHEVYAGFKLLRKVLLSNTEKTAVLSEILKGDSHSSSLPPVSAVLTLRNFISGLEAMKYLRGALQYLPEHLVTDIIIVLDMKAKESENTVIEDAMSDCEICRVFILNGTVYESLNFAVNFARNDYVAFVDCRVQLTDFWLEPMVAKLIVTPRAVVSPNVRLASSDGSLVNLGVYRTEITWDLGVVRGVDDMLLRLVQKDKPLFIDQTAVSKEVFVVRKDFFVRLERFDILPFTSGVEDAALSLKVLNCGGNILQSRYSVVFLPIPTGSVTSSVLRMQPDILNPTFSLQEYKMATSMLTTSKIWMDAFSIQYMACAAKGKLDPSFYHSRPIEKSYVFTDLDNDGALLKRTLIAMTCKLTNFRYMILLRQPKMTVPDKDSTYFGYIRTLNGLYAVGLPSTSPTSSESRLSEEERYQYVSDNFVLTRNSSLWIGPFSYAKGSIIYKNKFCVTYTTGAYLRLTRCSPQSQYQAFVYKHNSLSLASDPDTCVGVKGTEDISAPLRMMDCGTRESVKGFKFDVQFLEDCVK